MFRKTGAELEKGGTQCRTRFATTRHSRKTSRATGSFHEPGAGAPGAGRSADDEGDDVEGHGLINAPGAGAPGAGRSADDEGDDVEAHGLINAPNINQPNIN